MYFVLEPVLTDERVGETRGQIFPGEWRINRPIDNSIHKTRLRVGKDSMEGCRVLGGLGGLPVGQCSVGRLLTVTHSNPMRGN